MQPPPIERLQSLREAVTRVYRPSDSPPQLGDKCALDRPPMTLPGQVMMKEDVPYYISLIFHFRGHPGRSSAV